MIEMNKFRKFAPTFLRISISLVFLWFGINQIFNTELFLGYLPRWIVNYSVNPSTIVISNGIIELTIGILLLIGLFTKISSLFLSLKLIFTAINLGYNDIAVRDIGLALVTFSIFLYGYDKFCLDYKLKNKNIKNIK